MGKFVLPIGLMPIYPRWTFDPPSLVQLVAVPLMAIFVLGLWMKRKGWGRHVLFGFGFFLINLLPVAGLVEMSWMDLSWVADHFVYLPMIGLVGLAIAGLEFLHAQLQACFRPYLMGMAAVALAWMALGSHSYARNFVDQETLWTYAIKQNPEASRAYYSLSSVLFKQGRLSEALEPALQSVRLNPEDANAGLNLGEILAESGHLAEAREQFERVERMYPRNANAYGSLGIILIKTGQTADAIKQIETALQLDPDLPEAHNSLGVAFANTGRIPEAIEQFKAALQINPNYASARNNLARMEALEKTIPNSIHPH
jgi:tetratricopeptide (TPR) repeat protein